MSDQQAVKEVILRRYKEGILKIRGEVVTDQNQAYAFACRIASGKPKYWGKYLKGA